MKPALWHEIQPNGESISKFLGEYYEFHDFRLKKVEYICSENAIEVLLMEGIEGVLIRFLMIDGFHISVLRDYDCDYIFKSALLFLGNGNFLWIEDNDWGENPMKDIDKVKTYASWVEAKRVFWTVVDAEGNPVEVIDDNKVKE